MVARPPLLTVDPSAQAPDMRHLVGIAAAIESEAIRRYATLAQEMVRRGEHATAATFREMGEMEEHHREAVDRWASALNEPVPADETFAWLLPVEIAASWEEVRHSSLLTPYRALAIAVTNEERAFAFYAYVAASARDPRVAHEAEKMAREELAHAAELRVRRRQAYRRESGGHAHATVAAIDSMAAFRALERRLTEETVRAQREMAQGGSGSLAQLRGALQPLERASEIYEELIAQAPSEDLLAAEQSALTNVVEQIALLSRRIADLERAP